MRRGVKERATLLIARISPGDEVLTTPSAEYDALIGSPLIHTGVFVRNHSREWADLASFR